MRRLTRGSVCCQAKISAESASISEFDAGHVLCRPGTVARGDRFSITGDLISIDQRLISAIFQRVAPIMITRFTLLIILFRDIHPRSADQPARGIVKPHLCVQERRRCLQINANTGSIPIYYREIEAKDDRRSPPSLSAHSQFPAAAPYLNSIREVRFR